MSSASSGSTDNADFSRVYWTFSVVALLGIFAAFLYAYAASSTQLGASKILGAAVLVAGASGLCGGLGGFLFAIPRSRQDNTNSSQANTPDKPPSRLSDYSANTNLEQISDWLTKILVGAGLVQLSKIPGLFDSLATKLAPALGGTLVPPPAGDPAKPVVLCLIVFFLPWGFFFGYLITRLWLPKALNRAEQHQELRNREADLRAVEARAFNALYQTPPTGFTRAIELIDAHLKQADAERSPWLLLYLACAHGQRHAFQRKLGNQEGERLARNAAVSAVKEAMSLDPGILPNLRGLFLGNEGLDNDLVSLRGDEELEKLLGTEA